MQSIFFDVLHLYYLPQYLPVADELRKRGVNSVFVVHHSEDAITSVISQALDKEGFSKHLLSGADKALEYYLSEAPTWIVFGTSPPSAFSALQSDRQGTRASTLIYMCHGIGPKSTYYDTDSFNFDIRFVEGESRLKRLQEKAPDNTFVNVGYAKLDPLFNGGADSLSLIDLKLDPNKATVLYSPTFFPSSIERFPKNWPEKLQAYNLIIKPHFFSLTKPRYKKHRKLFEAWDAYENVYLCSLEDYSLLPFMNLADVMLSEASSTIFEFAAMDKPIVWCDFFHLRWSYRGPLKYRLGKRMDEDLAIFHQLCEHASSPKEALLKIAHSIDKPSVKSSIRTTLTLEMAGKTDGKCSRRIADYLLQTK